MRWIVAGIVLAALVLVWGWLRARRNRTNDPPPVSIVLLLAQPRNLNVHVLAPILSEAIGSPVKALDISDESDESDTEGQAGGRISGASPFFIGNFGDTSFLIHNHNSPYMSDPIAESQSIGEMRLQRAVREHKAWLSMDILNSGADTGESWRIIARVISKLIGPDCLALYYPPSNQLVACTDETPEKLLADDPIRAVFQQNNLVPVIPIDGDDPRMKAAVSQARSRFAEFQSAFEAKNGRDFAIKVPVTEGGNTEHVWVEVGSIGPDEIGGQLASEPVALGDYRLGSRISVKRSEIEDWTFRREDDLVGLFTLPVVQQIQEEQAAKK